MINPFLTGQEVYLRPLERADARIVQPWVNDPEIGRYLLIYRPFNLQAEEEFIDKVNHSDADICLLIARTSDDQAIGVTGFHQLNFKNRHAVFGINIGDKQCWGKGYGTEAGYLMMDYGFNTLNLNRVMLQVFEYNERAIHVYEKIGFQQEGILRQEHYRDGQYWDTIVMGLLRSEWEEHWQVNQSGDVV